MTHLSCLAPCSMPTYEDLLANQLVLPSTTMPITSEGEDEAQQAAEARTKFTLLPQP